AHISDMPGQASLNSHLLLLRPKRKAYCPRYLFYMLRSSVFQAYVQEEQTGTTFFGITQESIVNFPLLLPSIDEQVSIASFLDFETAKIDRLIAKQERLIELLQEKRQSIISRAVTEGLDPEAPMKNSSTEWLGDIPAHWETKRLKYLTPQVTVGIVITP